MTTMSAPCTKRAVQSPKAALYRAAKVGSPARGAAKVTMPLMLAASAGSL